MKPIVISATLVLFLPMAKQEARPTVEQELARLQGEWVMESGRVNGTEVPADVARSVRRTVVGKDFTIKRSGFVVSVGSFEIDPSKSPKTIDSTRKRGPSVNDPPMFGIYEIEGDAFRVCFGAPGAKRPESMADSKERHMISGVWRRVSKDESSPTEESPTREKLKDE